MPLVIIALVFILALIIYIKASKASNISDNRPVRERYPDVFKGATSDTTMDAEKKENNSQDDKTLYFPTENIETEKYKRNIH